MTPQQHYDAYMTASREIETIKAVIKQLRADGERAAMKARENTSGSTSDKIIAIRAAWVPFNEAIAQAEEALRGQYVISDREFESRGI